MKRKNDTPTNFIRTNLTLSEFTKAKAQADADALFSGNLSAYITHLILNNGITPTNTSSGNSSSYNTVNGNGAINAKTKIKK